MFNLNSNSSVSSSSQTNALFAADPHKHHIPPSAPSQPPLADESVQVILKAIENFENLSPFPKPNFIVHFFESFINFFNKIFGFKPSLTNNDLKLRLAMHLFKSFESSIAPAGHSSSFQEPLPLSMALESYCHMITNRSGHFGVSKNKLNALEQCVAYSKAIDEIKDSSLAFRQLRLRCLTHQIKNRISQLKDDECLYIPGGYAEYQQSEKKMEAQDLLSQPFNVVHMIYEVTRDPKDRSKIIFRVINNSFEGENRMNCKWGILSASQNFNTSLSTNSLFDEEQTLKKMGQAPIQNEYCLSENAFLENLQTLLEVQTIPHESYQMNWLGHIGYALREFINMIFSPRANTTDTNVKHPPTQKSKQEIDIHLVKNALPPFVQNLSSVKFCQIFQRFNDFRFKQSSNPSIISNTITKQKDSSSALKITQLFSRTLLNDHGSHRDVSLKVALFLDIYKLCLPRMGEKEIRLWVKNNLHSLMAYLEKNFSHHQNISKVIDTFENLSLQINQWEVNPPFLLPKEQASIPPGFDDLISFEENICPLNSFQDMRIPNLSPAEPVHSDFELKSSLESRFIGKLELCEALSKDKNIHEMKYHVREAFDMLLALDNESFWDTLPPQEIELWSQNIHQLAGYLCQVHFGLNLPGPTSVQILHILKVINISIKLAQKNDHTTGFGSFCLDMSAFKDILKDDYLNLSSEGPAISKTLKEIQEPGKIALGLSNANTISNQSKEDQQYFNSYFERNKKELQGYATLTEDFTPHKGKLSNQVIYLRRLKILALALMARYRTMGTPSVFSALKDSLATFVNSFTNPQVNLEKEYVIKVCSAIDKALNTQALPAEFTPTRHFLKEGKSVHASPYLYHIDYFNPLLDGVGSPFISKIIPSQYKNTEPLASDPIANKVIEGCVSNCEGVPVYDDGYPIIPVSNKSNEYSQGERTQNIPSGECHTEQYIFEEQLVELGLPTDIWANLRLTKTAPLGTRIPNTLDFFSAHPNFLGSCKLSLDMQRVFNLNLFRNNGLGEYLTRHPDYAHTLVSHLVTQFVKLKDAQNIEGALFIMSVTSNVCHILRHLIEYSKGKISKKYFNKYSKAIASLITLQCENQYPILEKWVHECENKGNLKAYARPIYQIYLLLNEDSIFKTTPLSLLKCWYKMHQIPQPAEAYNFLKEDRISYMMHKLMPKCEHQLNHLNTRRVFLNELAKELNLQVGIDDWKLTETPLVFQNGNIRLDLKKGLLFKKGVATCRLPDAVIQNPLCRAIFDDENIAEIWCNYKLVKLQDRKGVRCDFVYKQQKFAIILLAGQEPLIYKEMNLYKHSSPRWFQYSQTGVSKKETTDFIPLIQQTLQKLQKQGPSFSESSASQQAFPETILSNRLWISCQDNKFFVENPDRKLLYEGEFTDKGAQKKLDNRLTFQRKIKSIVLMTGDEPAPILNAWKNKSFHHFLALSNPSHIAAIGKGKDNVCRIKYLNHSLEYLWDEHTGRWQCKNFPEFTLSDKKIESVLCSHNGENINRNFFAAQFNNYHILEHPTQQPKLILPCQSYKKPSLSIAKNNRSLCPSTASALNTTYYEYTIEPFEGLKSSTPEGYCYLAYVLFTQSHYEQALFYLKKAQHITPETSLECQQILNWFSQWEASSLDAQVFMLHVYLLTLEQSPGIKKSRTLSVSQRALLISFLKACSQYDFTKPHPSLRLGQADYERIREYFEWIKDHNLDFEYLGSDRIMNEIEDKLGISLSAIKTRLHIPTPSLNNKKAELSKLNEGKENLEKSIDLSRSKELKIPAFQDKITPVFPSIRKFLKQGSLISDPPEIDKILNILEEKFKDKKNFANKIGYELVEDIREARRQWDAKPVFVEDKDFHNIQFNLEKEISELTQQAKTFRESILDVVFQDHKPSKWHTFDQELANSWESNSSSFNEILYAAAARELPEKEVNESAEKTFNAHYHVALKKGTKVSELDQTIRKYLVSITSLQQHQKAKDLIYQYSKTKSPTLKKALTDLLATERQYDCQTDSYAVATLLLEAELKIIARKNQIDLFRTMISTENNFYHAPLASGKTTFLRNLISKAKANRQILSCVITHEPLISLHHKQLESATSEAYGDKVYRFEFDREYPTDVCSLGIVRNQLMRCITENVRLDFTPHDILSLHHSLILKYDELVSAHRKRSLHVINDEIDTLSEIIEIFKTKACVSSDEFDKMVEANKQHNYGLGKPTQLNEYKCQAGSSLVKWILLDEEYQSIFQNSDIELWKFAKDKKFIHRFLENMAKKAIHQFLPDLNQSEELVAIQYLTKRKSQSSPDIINFRENRINKLPTEQQVTIKTFHKLFHKIIPDSFKKRNGLNYIRSEDGIQVKPVVRNGKCSELSEFGNEEETIWYTCLNYMNCKNKKTVGGVTQEQIAQLISDLKDESTAVIARQLKENPHEYIVFNETASAKKFKQDFEIDLDAVTPVHYLLLAERMNKNPKQLAKFLNQYVFPVTDHRPEQIVGTPQHLVAMFKEFSGSSGTSNIWRSLPDQIQVDPEHVKQPGVDGNLFLNLFRTFSASDLIKYNDKDNIPEQMACVLKNLEGLIDCAALFAGLNADKIVQSIASYMPNNTRFRYNNVQDQEVVFDNSTKTLSPENPASIDKSVTVFDEDQTRGTHKVMPFQSTALLTLNLLTALTKYQQSTMRMRGYGRGQSCKFFADPKTYECLVDREPNKIWLNQKPDSQEDKGPLQDKSQKVSARPSKPPLDLEKINILVNLIVMLCQNESEFLKNQHHLKSEIQKIQTVGENTLFRYLCQLKDRKLRSQVWEKCRHFFIKPSQETLETLDEASKQPSIEGFKKLAQIEKEKLETFKQHLLGLNFNESNPFILSLNDCINTLDSKAKGKNLLGLEYLPSKAYFSSSHLNMNNSVQKDQNIMADREIETELDLEKDQKNPPKPRVDSVWKSLWQTGEVNDLETLVKKIEQPRPSSSLQRVNQHAKFYDENLFCTYNLYKPANKRQNPLATDSLPWTDTPSDGPLPQGQTPLLRIALIVDRRSDPCKVYGLLGSSKDFDHVFSKINPSRAKDDNRNDELDFYIYSLTSDLLEDGKWHKNYSSEVQQQIARLIVQAKHLTGEVELINPTGTSKNHIINSQFTAFQQWLTDKLNQKLINIVNLEANLKKYLRKFHPTTAHKYKSSSMAKAYQICKERCSINLKASHEAIKT